MFALLHGFYSYAETVGRLFCRQMASCLLGVSISYEVNMQSISTVNNVHV